MKGIVYPLLVNKRRILTSEALYQACRFPDYPEIQEEIIKQKSPMAAKMKSKPHRLKCTRADFEEEKVAIMYWCLRVKLACNPNGFGHLLKKTGTRPIVEVSHKDLFWGTKEDKSNPNNVIGVNVLGQLLMELRSFYLENQVSKAYLTVEPLDIANFKLFGEPIEPVVHPILKLN
ncbi:NADAR family protein [Flavobacterium cheonanense]|uniref:NADAR family protein n=3 Tax=Flavobacteriaceae TaxID=49546 RepID=A0ABP7UUJ6_9FLAO